MLADSCLLRDLNQHAFSTTREPMALYGDPARIPYACPPLSPLQKCRNNTANGVVKQSHERRSCVLWSRWLFGNIIDFKKNLKLFLSVVGKMYVVCAVLRNALTCMYTNSTSDVTFSWTLQPLKIIFLEHLLLFICKT